jgi:hypothetical protein
MNIIQLTPENIFQYIGHEIIFKNSNNRIVNELLVYPIQANLYT